MVVWGSMVIQTKVKKKHKKQVKDPNTSLAALSDKRRAGVLEIILLN